MRAIAREKQQSARQPFLAGVEELVYEGLFDPDVSRKHIGDEAVGELVFLVEDAKHLVFLDDEHVCDRDRCGGRHVFGLPSQASFPSKIAWFQDRHNNFFASFIDYCKLHTAFLNVHNILGSIALCEDGFFSSKLAYCSPQTGRFEKRMHIESKGSQIRFLGVAKDGSASNCGRKHRPY